MALPDLIIHVETELATTESVTLDEAGFFQAMKGNQMPLTRRTGNLVAEVFIHTHRDSVASVETFQQPETGRLLFFMLFARTLDSWEKARESLVKQVSEAEGQPVKQLKTIEHPH